MTARWSARPAWRTPGSSIPTPSWPCWSGRWACTAGRSSRRGGGFPAELPIIKELYVAPDRRTALAECRPFLEAKYKAYASWGQDKALPEGETFDLDFEELIADRFIIGDPDDAVREIQRYADALDVNCFIFRVQWPGMEQAKVLRTIKLLAERVLPALRAHERGAAAGR